MATFLQSQRPSRASNGASFHYLSILDCVPCRSSLAPCSSVESHVKDVALFESPCAGVLQNTPRHVSKKAACMKQRKYLGRSRSYFRARIQMQKASNRIRLYVHNSMQRILVAHRSQVLLRFVPTSGNSCQLTLLTWQFQNDLLGWHPYVDLTP